MTKKVKESRFAPLIAKVHNKFRIRKNSKRSIFCVGAPRTGTHSIANIFSNILQARHEPGAIPTLVHLLRWFKGKYSYSQIKCILRFRQYWLDLDLESSHFLVSCIRPIKEISKNPKFILTVRSPEAWLKSEVNQLHRTNNRKTEESSREAKIWSKYSEYTYGEMFDGEYRKEGEKKVYPYPLEKMAKYYVWHNRKIIEQVKSKNIIVVETPRIESEINRIKKFCGIESHENIREDRTHSNSLGYPIDIYSVTSVAYVREVFYRVGWDQVESRLRE